jgi:hypothetical protein
MSDEIKRDCPLGPAESIRAEERRLRRLAKQSGFTLVKSRARRPSFENKGRYAILNFYGSEVWGWTYQLELLDVRQILESYRQPARCAWPLW